MKQQKFKILKTGNFYFPFINRNEKFVVENTIDLTLSKKDTDQIDFCLKHNILHFGMLAEPIWGALKSTLKKELNKEYKNCWFCSMYVA